MSDKQITQFDQLKEGEFVRFVDRDKQGRFSYVGQLIKVQPETKEHQQCFEMLTYDGIMGFHVDNELDIELFENATKPKGWAKFVKDPKKFLNTTTEEVKPVEPVKTKKQQVMDLVAANPRKAEKSLLKLAMKEIGGSEVQLTNFIKLALAKK